MDENLKKQFDQLKREVEALKQKRVTQDSIIPQVIKNRHLEDGVATLDKIGSDVFLDEDDLASESTSAGATQSSIKYYIDHIGTIYDTNGNEVGSFTPVSSAVNYIQQTNSATNTPPILSAVGDDTNIHIKLKAKGTGSLVMPVVRQGADASDWSVPATSGTSVTYNEENAFIQVGYKEKATAGTTGEELPVTFPVAFANIPIVIACPVIDYDGESDADKIPYKILVKEEDISTTAFTVQSYFGGGTFAGNYGIMWIAIGDIL